MKLRIAMPLIRANPDTDDMVLRPPSPFSTFPLTPQLLCYPKFVPNSFKKTGESLSALDEQKHPFHKELQALAVHCRRVAQAARFPAASEH